MMYSKIKVTVNTSIFLNGGIFMADLHREVNSYETDRSEKKIGTAFQS